MFRLFRRLRSRKKSEQQRKDDAETSETENAAVEESTAMTMASSSVIDAENMPENMESSQHVPAHDESTLGSIQSHEMGHSALIKENESTSTLDSMELSHSTISSGLSLGESTSDDEVEGILPELDTVQQEVALLEELITRETPTFNPEELVEAVLFAAGRPLRLEEIVEATELNSTEIKRAITQLKKKLANNSAFYIKEISNELWVLQLKDKFRPIAAFLRDEQSMLSEDELLVLTHIAYRQPISQAVLAKILSYKIDPARVRQLVSNLYLKEYVTMEKKARSVILRTTEKFCREFGFDTDQRRMKIQLIWRLKRRMRHLS